MIVLSIAVMVAPYGARGVAVAGGVLVGGTRDTEVGDGIRVMVGARVGDSVASTTVGVHVASSCNGVMVAVGKSKGVGILGLSGFRAVCGKKNTYAINAASTPLASSANTVNRSRTFNRERWGRTGCSSISKSKRSRIRRLHGSPGTRPNLQPAASTRQPQKVGISRAPERPWPWRAAV